MSELTRAQVCIGDTCVLAQHRKTQEVAGQMRDRDRGHGQFGAKRGEIEATPPARIEPPAAAR